ncbi:hypothetical protein L917_15295 [Phytophthora nicotianae]|uniref:ARS-binding protein 1 N-terminal domain-containing protein n=1 Tax=Phytophthora nicotianae TaxID=4792 RepID=W2KIP4_PHYNI|nr:hypothetical protein L917_15295 [Phytophthora nicotianae]
MGTWLKIHQKRGIIKKAGDCPGLTQNELAAWAKITYRLKRPPAQTTISDILNMAPQIMSDDYGDGKWCKSLRVTSPQLEKGAVGVDSEGRGARRMPLT